MKFSEIDVLSSLCRESFEDFCREFWSTVVPETLIWNWHMSVICEEMQQVAERIFAGLPKLYDLVINVSPGSSKSTIASIMFPAWCWTRMPTFRFIGASYAFPLALDLSRKCRDVVKSDLYRACFPEIELREDQDTKGYFVNSFGGQRYSTGSCGAVTGMHGHCIGIDDPIDPNRAVSEIEMYQINNWIKQTLTSRKVDRRTSPMILVMQRLHQEDPAAQFLKKKKRVRHVCMPAELTNDVQPASLRHFYKQGLMDPQRLPKDVLEDAEQEMGSYGYAGQYLQSPVPESGGMFEVSRLRVEMPGPIMRAVRYWDKAGTANKSKKGRGAFTVGVKMGVDKDNQVVILDVIRVRMNSFQREKLIMETAEYDGDSVIPIVEQEGGSGGKESAEGTVRRLLGFKVKIDIPKGDKETRADPFSVQVNAGNVILVPADWNDDYINELKYFPFSTTKDQVDASAGALAHLAVRRRRVGGMRDSTEFGGSRVPPGGPNSKRTQRQKLRAKISVKSF